MLAQLAVHPAMVGVVGVHTASTAVAISHAKATSKPWADTGVAAKPEVTPQADVSTVRLAASRSGTLARF